jgi:glycosyltransferase involved in cell wall biosynthesis
VILHLTTFLQGGAGRAIADLASAQRAAGRDVMVATSATGVPGYDNYPEYLARLAREGVPVRQIESLFARDVASNLRAVEALRDLVAPPRVELMHAHAATPAVIGRLLAGHAPHRIPIVQTQHGWGTRKTPEQAQADLAVLRDVDHVIVTSGATRDLLTGLGGPADRMSVIPCGLAPHADTGDVPEAYEPLDRLWSAGAKLVGCIGTVNDNKNQRLLVEALPHLPGDVAAVFIGEGGDVLRGHARALGVADRVVVCGYQSRASAWLPFFDVVAVPSKTEGQGLVVLEAFRAGVPVVASAIPALAELIEDGRTGFLYEGGDPAALAAAVGRALALERVPRGALVEAARATFADRYSLETMVARHDALYGRLTRGRSWPRTAAA